MIKDEKKVPKREAVSKFWFEEYDRYDVSWHGWGPIYLENWRDFVRMKVEETASKNLEYLSKSESDIIDLIMRRGSINLGNNCMITKCPGINKPGVCVLFPVRYEGEEKLICSGPTVQKTKGGIIRSKSTYYEEEFPKCRAYNFLRFLGERSKRRDFVAYIHQELHKHPDYTVVDAFEEWSEATEKLREGVEKYK